MMFRPLEIVVSQEQIGFCIGSFYFGSLEGLEDFKAFFGIVLDRQIKTLYIPLFFFDLFIDYGVEGNGS